LLARLDEALDARLTLVSAPAGFGKTTLVGEWLRQHENVAWLTLDAEDNDPVRFWRYVIAACRAFDESLGQDALSSLRASAQTPLAAMVSSFINDLANLREPCVLVLEDYHVVFSEQINETMAYWLDHLPAAMHVVVLSRSDPPLPLARLRARNQLREIRADDLRFTHDEAEAFMRRALGDAISPDLFARLDARMEGWPAGWRMFTLLAQRQRSAADVERVAASFDGRHQHVSEYFVGEVLAAQPPDIQEFLLRTVFLERFNAALCDFVTERSDSDGLLDQLDHSNLFLQRLNVEGGKAWYRYHSLFAEAMRHVARQRLGQTTLRGLAARASAWHEAQGNLPEAIETAFAADEPVRAAMLIEQFVERGLYEELYSQRRWLERLPQVVLFARPALCLAHASAVLFTEDRRAPATRARIEPYLAQAEQAWRADGSTERLGELLAFRAMIAFWQDEYTENSMLAREALKLLPESNAEWRGVSLLQVTFEEIRAGRIAELPSLAMEARALCAAAGNLPAALAALTALCEISYWRGEFRQATLYAEQTLEEAAPLQTRLHYHSDQQTALTQLALIAFEQNDLERADQFVTQAIDFGPQADEPDWLKRATLLQLRLRHTRGETAQARDALQQFVATEKSPALIHEAQLLQARLALLGGEAALAQRALANLPSFGLRLRLEEEVESLLRARLLLVQHQAGDALHLVRKWREDAHTNERARCEIEWAMIESLAQAQRDDFPRARLALADALKLAQPEGITRLFLEAGPPLAVLLRESLPHWRDAEIESFAHELLALIVGEEPAGASSNVPELAEPLSVQERRVLRLLAAGMTNAEIARELTVSVNTVKTQTQSIYRKLGVNNRDEARDFARRMKLV
jgi:LuxR family maltose regulon positive regulatory protein